MAEQPHAEADRGSSLREDPFGDAYRALFGRDLPIDSPRDTRSSAEVDRDDRMIERYKSLTDY